MNKAKIGHQNDCFRLLKDTDNLKKGKNFESFGGLVCGVVTKIEGKETVIRFDDKNWFKIIERKKFTINKNFLPYEP